MRRRLTAMLVSLFAVVAMGAAFAPAAAGAQGVLDVCKQGAAKNSSVCKAPGTNNISGPNGIIIKVANIFAFAGGVAAVFVIMIGGFMMITANGDTGKQTTGQHAVIYAAIGLVVIVLGRAIIGFVITSFR